MTLKLNIPLPSKGLMVDRPGEYTDSRSMTNGRNMEVNRSIIRKRCGSSAVGSSLGERIMRYFELQVGSATRLFRVGISKVQVLNKATGVWSNVHNTLLTGGSGDCISYAFPLLSGEKIVVFTNGIDAIRKCSITGSDANLGGTPPKAKFVINLGSYLLLANITDDGAGNEYSARVQWCDTGDPENWTTGNAGSIDLVEDAGDITGTGNVKGFGTIHKPDAIYLAQIVTTSDVIRFDRVSTGLGTIAGATIWNIPSGEEVFLASDGIRIFNGAESRLVPSPVQDELRESINPGEAYKSQAVIVKELNEYWVCVPTGSSTEPDTIYKYNYVTQEVYKDEHEDMSAIGIYQNISALTWADMTVPWSSITTRWNSVTLGSLNPVVIYGDSSGVSTKRVTTVYNDNGTAIEGSFETKDFTAKDFGIDAIDSIMRWTGMELWAIGDSVKVYYSTDSGGTWTLADTLELSAEYPDDDAPLNVWFDVVKSKIRFKFYNAVAGETFTLKKYLIEAAQREARQ